MQRIWLCVCLWACTSPGTSTPATTNPKGPTGASNTAMSVAYALSTVSGCAGNPGVQTVIAQKGNGFALATLAELPTSDTSDCTPVGRPTTQVQNYQVCYSEDGNAGVEVAKIPLIAFTGLGFAVSSASEVSIGFPGGPNATQRCGGSDMVVATKSGASFTQSTIIAGSAASIPADQQADCLSICAAGDATGYWPALAYAGNALVAAFRDMHFGVDDNARASTDVELSRGGGVTTIDGAHGGGIDNRIAIDSSNRVSIAFRNRDGQVARQGLWVIRETATGFTRTQVTTDNAGEQLGFAVSSSGVHGLAYYSVDGKKLVYVQSNDGITWDTPEDVDTDGVTGQFPTLAFDASGVATVAYYRCSDYPGDGVNCNTSQDGLMIAKRGSDRWRSQRVTNEGASFDGRYPALTFVAGKAVIAYRQTTLDPSTGVSTSELKIAKEP